MAGGSEVMVVSNEFAAVSIRKIETRNGERLQIHSLEHEHTILLDAIALEALTWSDPLEVGMGLETPFGPEPSAPGQHDPHDGTTGPEGDRTPSRAEETEETEETTET